MLNIMPLYEYECESCGYRFDEMSKIDDRHQPRSCPKCQGNSTLAPSAAAVLSGAAPCSSRGSDRPSCCSRQGGRCPY